uniref:Uncharacterized protein n=1 Tax=Rhizophora mucronata TaxID=61149 RepID=A0A2P2JAH1_RHIMU
MCNSWTVVPCVEVSWLTGLTPFLVLQLQDMVAYFCQEMDGQESTIFLPNLDFVSVTLVFVIQLVYS